MSVNGWISSVGMAASTLKRPSGHVLHFSQWILETRTATKGGINEVVDFRNTLYC
jgi:hypothetical protein